MNAVTQVVYVESTKEPDTIIVQTKKTEENGNMLIVLIVVGMLASSVLTFIIVKITKAC